MPQIVVTGTGLITKAAPVLKTPANGAAICSEGKAESVSSCLLVVMSGIGDSVRSAQSLFSHAPVSLAETW